MRDTNKNALAELANKLTWIEDILRSEGYDSYCDEANKAQRIVAELAKVEDWTNDFGADEPRPYSSVSAIEECRAIAEKEIEMSDEKQDTIADIAREMRSFEFDDPRLDIYSLMATRDLVRGWANRIEAAWKRERETGAEAAQICGETCEMVGRGAAGPQPVTDCNRLGNAARMREVRKEK